MKIKLKVSLSGINFSYYEGQEIDIDDAIGKQWVEANYAEPMSNASNKRSKAEKEVK